MAESLPSIPTLPPLEAATAGPDTHPAGDVSTIATDLAAMYGTPLLVIDCDEVRRRYRALARALPNVRLYYAMKAFPQDEVIRVLAQEGARFDVASTGELQALYANGVDTSACLHTHPVKRPKDIEAALAFGVSRFVFDHAEELDKLRPHADRIELLLRIGYRGKHVMVDLANKFGCAPEEADALLARARALGLRVSGLTFHVGSQSLDATGHVNAVMSATEMLKRHPELSILDIGGGFPVTYDQVVPDIEHFCAPIRAALSAVPRGINCIAEPGRYLVASAVTGIASVMGHADRAGKRWYYLDDGVYGSFSGRIFDHARYPLWAAGTDEEAQPCVVAGPTCDGLDIVEPDAVLPPLKTGDLVLAGMMGAYTTASATQFNAFPKAQVIALNESHIRTVEAAE